MKIVKFENGTYGVRRWSFVVLAYEFANRLGDQWYTNLPQWRKHFEFSIAAAEEVLEKLEMPQPKKKDNGRPVTKKTRVPPLGGMVRCLCCRK